MNKNTLKKLKNKSAGESLLEVIVAVLMVAIGAGTASTLIVQSLTMNQFNRDHMMAINLSKEGIEMMKVVIDTNWIKFSGDYDNCWNMSPHEDICDDNARIEAGFYAWGVKMSEKNPEDVELDLNQSNQDNEFYRLYEFELNDDYGDVKFIGSNDGTDDPGDNPTKFYRSIEIGYERYDNNIELQTPSATPHLDSQFMTIKSKVQWRATGGIIHQVVLESGLSNNK